MIISCPYCAFSRTIDENKIPAAAQTATCPKCQHKFRFRESGAAGQSPASGPIPAQQSDYQNAPGPESGLAPEPAAGGPDAWGGVPGPGAEHSAEQGEDIWDRVASLGESWATDDESEPDTSAPSRHGASRDKKWESSVEIPWEHARDKGLFKAFLRTAWLAVFQPRRFFGSLETPHPIGLSLIFYLVIAALQTYLFQAWLQLFPVDALGLAVPSVHALYDSSRPLYIILAAPVVCMVFLAVVSASSALAIRLLGGKKVSPAAIMRLMAYASAPMLLGVLPFFGAVLGQVWAMLLFLFGCKYVFRLNAITIIAALLPVYLCLAVLRIILFGSF